MTPVPSKHAEGVARALDEAFEVAIERSPLDAGLLTIKDASGMLRSLASERDALLAKVEAVEVDRDTSRAVVAGLSTSLRDRNEELDAWREYGIAMIRRYVLGVDDCQLDAARKKLIALGEDVS